MKITTATIVSAIALSVAAAASAEQVRVYNWSDYIDESLLAKFEEETGIAPVVITGIKSNTNTKDKYSAALRAVIGAPCS